MSFRTNVGLWGISTMKYGRIVRHDSSRSESSVAEIARIISHSFYPCLTSINRFIFFQAVTVTNSAIWLVLSAVRIFLSLTTVTVTLAWVCLEKKKSRLREGKKIIKLFTGLGSVRIVKNCDLGLENAALGLRLRAAFSRPRSQFFTIRTFQPANNIYILSNKQANRPCKLSH